MCRFNILPSFVTKETCVFITMVDKDRNVHNQRFTLWNESGWFRFIHRHSGWNRKFAENMVAKIKEQINN